MANSKLDLVKLSVLGLHETKRIRWSQHPYLTIPINYNVSIAILHSKVLADS